MFCGKCCRFLINVILPYSILCIFLFQLYSQYSAVVTLRTKFDNKKDGRKTLTNYQLIKDKNYDFNMNKVKEYFEDNAIMNIPFVKDFTLGLIEKRNINNDEDFDNRIYMFYYLIFYDIISILVVYCFIYGNIEAGLLKIIFQIIRFYFNAKRLKKFNTNIGLFSIINSKIENMYLYRGWSIFNPEGFIIIEFLCNFAIILDIILLSIYIHRIRKYRRNKKLNFDDDGTDNSNGEENDEKNNKIDGEKRKEDLDESNEESKPNNNYIKGKSDFKKEDEVSEELDNINNINNNNNIEGTHDE